MSGTLTSVLVRESILDLRLSPTSLNYDMEVSPQRRKIKKMWQQ